MIEMLLLFFAAGAAYTDYKQRKIPNAWILAGVMSGLLSHFLRGGVTALGAAFLGGVLGLVPGYVLWLLHVFKAGDGKLLWMIGTILGYAAMWPYLAAALLFSGAAALVLMIRQGIFLRRMRRVGLYLRGMLLNRRFQAYLPEENDRVRMPFAVTAFLGMALYMIVGNFG